MLYRGTTFARRKRIAKRGGGGSDTKKTNDNDNNKNNKNKNYGSDDYKEDEMIRRLDEARKRDGIDFDGNAKVDLGGVDMKGFFQSVVDAEEDGDEDNDDNNDGDDDKEKESYLFYVRRDKFGTTSSLSGLLPTLTFMVNCVVELYSLDCASSYQHNFV